MSLRSWNPEQQGPVVASGELERRRWEYRVRIDGSRLTEYFSAPGGSTARSTVVPDGVIACLGWGGERTPGRPSGDLMHVRGIVRKLSAVQVHLLDRTMVEAEVIDVGHASVDLFVAVMPPRSAMWHHVVAIDADGRESGRVMRSAYRR